MENKMFVFLWFSLTLFLTILLFASVFPRTYEVYKERQTLLKRNPDVFETWANKPLRQQRKFYFHNVTNGDEFLLSDGQMKFKEIGPFTYDVKQKHGNVPSNHSGIANYLRYSDLDFVLDDSVAQENATIYLPHPGTNSSGRERNFEISASNHHASFKSGTLLKIMVKDIVIKVMNDRGLWMSSEQLKELSVNSQHSTGIRSAAGSSEKDNIATSGSCSKISGVFRILKASFVDDPETLNVFQSLPCRCMNLVSNGTEIERRWYPEKFQMLINKMVFLWNDISYSRKDNISEGIIDSSNSEVSFKRSSFQSRFNIEPISNIVTRFSLQYETIILLEHFGIGNTSNTTYPFLRTEICGISTAETDTFLYNNVIFPRIFMDKILPRIVFFSVCFFVAIVAVMYIIIFHDRDDENVDEEATPLLKANILSTVGSWRNTSYT